eukprot:scaffold21912_cov127-Isochrysis_galbana.AAC.3
MDRTLDILAAERPAASTAMTLQRSSSSRCAPRTSTALPPYPATRVFSLDLGRVPAITVMRDALLLLDLECYFMHCILFVACKFLAVLHALP